MPGAPKIILHKSLIRRLVWLLCFFGSWTMFFIQTQLVFRNYFTYPKNTQVEIVSEYRQFPDLTFCFRRGVSLYDAHEWLMRKHERLTRNETLESIMADMKLLQSIVYDVALFDPSFHSVELQAYINRSAITKEEAFMSLDLLSATSHYALTEIDLLQMVKEIPGGEFLKCFTVPVRIYTDRVDLAIDIYLLTGSGMIPDMSGESEYPWKDISSHEGAIVYIHQPGVKINPIYDTQFYNLEPNHEYNFLVNAKQHVRLGHPYGQCTSRDPFVQIRQTRLDVPYRQQNCELSCLAKNILEKTGNVSMWLPPLDGMRCWLDENATLVLQVLEKRNAIHVKRWCNYSTLETDSGNPGEVNTTQASFDWLNEITVDYCPCYPPCNETVYDVSVTSRPNPFRSDQDTWFDFIFQVVGFVIFISF